MAERDYCLRSASPTQLRTVRDLANDWIDAKERLIGPELTQRTFGRYLRTGKKIVDAIGNKACSQLTPDDMSIVRAALSQTPTSLSCEVAIARMMFKYGNEYFGLGIRYATLKPPSAGVMRRHRAAGSRRMYTPDEMRKILRKSGELRPMILLGLNGGLGNQDVYDLPWSAITGGWIDYPRRKTGVDRRFPLWPETIKALPKKSDGPMFKSCRSNLSKRFADITRSLGLHRPRVSFYVCRHIFATVGSRTAMGKPYRAFSATLMNRCRAPSKSL